MVWGERLAIGVDGRGDSGVKAVLLFLLGESLASLLVGPLVSAGLSAPAMRGLLLMLARRGSGQYLKIQTAQRSTHAMPVRLWRSSRPVRVPRPPYPRPPRDPRPRLPISRCSFGPNRYQWTLNEEFKRTTYLSNGQGVYPDAGHHLVDWRGC